MKPHALFLVLVLAAVPGCFPDSEGFTNMELLLPLDSLAGTVDDADIDAYKRFAQKKQELTGLEFDLGQDGKNFYLGLYLTCAGEKDVSLWAKGDWLFFNDTTRELDISLQVGACQQGVFRTSIYWLSVDNGGAIQVFTGTSSPADLPGPQVITLDAYLHPSGSAGCLDDPGEGTFYYAAFDTDEHVRLPWQTKVASAGDSVEFTAEGLAVGRPYVLQRGQKSATGAGIDWHDISETFTLISSGQHIEDACGQFPVQQK